LNPYAVLAAADFKSAVYTNFTIPAGGDTAEDYSAVSGAALRFHAFGDRHCGNEKGKAVGKLPSTFPFVLEREKSLELSTYTLARYRSTN
jgi:hypothetical protein